MREVFDIIKQIQAKSGRNDKEAILAKHKDNRQFRMVLKNAFDPYLIFGIKDKKLNKFLKTAKGINSKFQSLEEVFEYLKVNNTGTDAVVKEVAEYLMTEYDEELRQYLYETITKKLRIGATAKSINKAFGEQFIKEFNVMLAKKFEDEQHKLKGKEFVITEKLDGMRILLIVEGESIKSFSRQGQPVLQLVEIEEHAKYLPDGVYDGELLIANADDYKDRDVLQETLKISRRDGEKKNLVFHCFDMLPIEEFHKGKSNDKYLHRRMRLELLIKHLKSPFIKMLPVMYKGNDLNVISELLEQMDNQGKEGLMLNLNGYWEGKRSDQLLKIKTMQTFDGRVIGFEEGDGKLKGTLGALIIDYKGFELRCGSGFTESDRDEIWNKRDYYLHKIAEIQYFRESKSKDGNLSVSFPIYKHWRLEKDEPSFH